MPTITARDIVVGSASAPMVKSKEWANLRVALPSALMQMSKAYTGLDRSLKTEEDQIQKMETLLAEMASLVNSVKQNAMAAA